MTEPFEGLARLQKTLGPYIRTRQEASHVRRVLALHLREVHGREQDGASSLPLPLQEMNEHVKSSTSRGLQKDYLKSLRSNTKARKEYASISSEHLHHTSTNNSFSKGPGQALEHPLENYVFLLKQQRRLERLHVVAGYLDHLDQKPAASQKFLDPKSIIEGIEPLPPIPSDVLYNDHNTDNGTPAKSVTEHIRQLEKAVLQARSLLDAEKRRTADCKSRMSQVGRRSSRGKIKQKHEALGRTRNDMISWMEEQLGKTGDSEDDTEEARIQQPKISAESQLINIQKEYRRYVMAREDLLIALKGEPESGSIDQAVEERQTSPEVSEPEQGASNLHPYLTELLSISNEQKSQILQRSHMNTCLAKLQKESMQSMDRLAEESHLLPAYPMKATKAMQPQRHAERPDSSSMLVVSERPDFISRARGWVFAADAAGHATRDAVLEKVEEGRASVDESLHALLGLHQLLGYDIEEEADEDDIWATDAKSAKKRSDPGGNSEGTEQSRRDIWSRVNGNLGVISRRENE